MVIFSIAGLLLTMAFISGAAVKIPPPTARTEFGTTATLPCHLESEGDIIWEKRAYNSSKWDVVPSKDKHLTLENVGLKDLGIYRCRNSSNDISCEIGLRVYRLPYSRLFNLKDSEKNVILMVEGILLLGFVIIPGTILLRKKSQKSLRERIQRYKEENENLYQVPTIKEMTPHEEISTGKVHHHWMTKQISHVTTGQQTRARLASFNVCKEMLRMFYLSVVESALFYMVACWGGSIKKRDASRLNKLGLNQEDQATYEDITRGQQSMYQDVANCRRSVVDLEKP